MTDQLLLLAGGKATRLRPVTETIPKSMLDVAGAPFIDHQLRLIQRNGIRRVLICASFLGEQIREHVGSGGRIGLEVEYSFDGNKLLGTGGAVKKALGRLDGSFFVMYGDSYLITDFRVINEYFFRQNKLGLMTVYRNEGKWDSSNVQFEDGRIVAYDKVNRTPLMKHIDYGLGILTRDAFADFSDREVFDLAEVYGQLIKRNELAGLEVSERFYEIGSFSGLEETSRFLSQKQMDN